jgi:hypothetical protein
MISFRQTDANGCNAPKSTALKSTAPSFGVMLWGQVDQFLVAHDTLDR